MGDELAFVDAVGQAALVANGELSASELVESAIGRIEELDGQINAVIHPRFEAARKEAAAGPVGPFAGVPMLLKDLGAAMAGEPLHLGHGFLKEAHFRAREDSYIVEKLRAAGLVVLGRTNCPELGTSITTEPLAYGPTRNPWNLDHTVGGSSGGSAAAVASGMVPVAHANDGGGSIRIPAANCGLVGLKPSRGRVSQGPLPGEAAWAGATIDHVVTRTVRDSASLLDVLAGAMPGDLFVAPPPARLFADSVSERPERLKIGLLDHAVMEGFDCDPECAEAARRGARLLEGLGHHVEEAFPEAMADADFTRYFITLITTAVACDLEYWSNELGRTVGVDELEPDNQLFHALGSSVPGPSYLGAVLALEPWRRRMASFWAADGYDLLVSPVLATPPARIGELSEPILGQQRVMAAMQYTPQFNVTGQPAISLPLHQTPDGLPVGVQLVAAYGREDLLISVAASLEEAAPWADRLPPLHA
jgi:amidase